MGATAPCEWVPMCGCRSSPGILSSQDNQTLTVWLASFTTSRGTDWGPLMAAATLTSLPVVVFFALVQRKVAFGLTAGAASCES